MAMVMRVRIIRKTLITMLFIHLSLPDLTQACFRALDVIFVLDSSAGVGSTNFNTMTSAVSSTAAYVMAGMNSRVGVITYGSTLQNQPLTFDESVVNGKYPPSPLPPRWLSG